MEYFFNDVGHDNLLKTALKDNTITIDGKQRNPTIFLFKDAEETKQFSLSRGPLFLISPHF
jgi:hypothetical protein